MKKILLLMSFIGAGYAASCETLPPLLFKSLTDSGKNGAQYVLVVNKYDAQSGFYADVWAFNGKELKHANHIKDVDVTKIINAGKALTEDKKVLKNLIKFENPLEKDKDKKVKETKSKAKKEDSTENIDKKAVKKSSTKSSKKSDVVAKKDAKKELATAKADYKKSGEALAKAKTKKAKQTAQAARARAGKALIKAENAVK
jgi:hypothetical protein